MARPSRFSFPLRSFAALGASLAIVATASVAYVSLHDASKGDSADPRADLRADLRATLSATSPTSTPPVAAPLPTPTTPWLPTRARVATFNLLGYGHTEPGGDNRLKVNGRTRQSQANQIIRANNLQIIGFQEMESPQIDVFRSELGAQFDLWPAYDYTGKSAVNVRGNSIAWRKDLWTAVSKTYYDAPYFKGANVPRPIVLLQNNATGQQVYVANTHDPANTFGNAKNYRTQAVNRHIVTFNALRKAHPGIPIFFTGDMNAKADFFCALTKGTSLRAVNGGTRTATKCSLPKSPQIDWIMSTTDVQWNGYQSVRTAYVKQTTDHPVIWADATFKAPMVARSGIARSVVIDIEGLPSAAISGARSSWAPHLNALRAAGTSTVNARTTAEVASSLPNLVSILTGRPISKSFSGHRVSFGKDKPKSKKYKTFTKATGKYVNTLFDTVHNQGGATSFMSSDPNAAIVIRSARAGQADTQGVNYGTKKLTVASIRSSDAAAVTVMKRQLAQSPRKLSYLQLTGPRVAGEKYGYFSAKYRAAVIQADRRVAQVLKAIKSSARTANSTALVITASSGGAQKKTAGTALTQIRVPLIVWGPTIPARSDLYALNPAFADPGVARVTYTGAQPLRNSNVANIVTTLLGYPTLPTPLPATGAINLFQPANLLQRR